MISDVSPLMPLAPRRRWLPTVAIGPVAPSRVLLSKELAVTHESGTRVNIVTKICVVAVAATSTVVLAGCGGGDSNSAPAKSATPSSAQSSSTSPSAASSAPSSASPSVDAQMIGIKSQGIGIDVMDWSNKHNFAIPTPKQFKTEVKYAKDLPKNYKVSYKTFPKNNYRICLVDYTGGTARGWGIFDANSGLPKSGTGAPSETWCP